MGGDCDLTIWLTHEQPIMNNDVQTRTDFYDYAVLGHSDSMLAGGGLRLV